MKQHLTEQTTLFASVIKWSCYATLVGILVGIGTTIFLRTLTWTTTMGYAVSNFAHCHLTASYFEH